MPSVAKILEAMRKNSKNIKYNDLLKGGIDYFGEPRTTGGSHAVFKMPWAGDPRVNIQDDKGKAKSYQVIQVLAAIDKIDSEGKQS
ncbi:toxin HicA [Aeromicrobium sp. A1-2]|nr:toxin HicA [Aeromicrobium sp. A1-2]